MNNPVRAIRQPKANRTRDRRLIPGEEERLLATTEPSVPASAVRFVLETAMGRGEVTAMHWEHVDFNHRILFILEIKTDTPRQISLSSRVMAVLDALPK
jgi:integrase